MIFGNHQKKRNCIKRTRALARGVWGVSPTRSESGGKPLERCGQSAERGRRSRLSILRRGYPRLKRWSKHGGKVTTVLLALKRLLGLLTARAC